MPKLESPCLTCDLKDSSKDNSVCKDCDARCDYVRVMCGGVPSTAIKPATMRISMSDLKKAELYIQQTCKKYFVELEDLKSQRYAGGLGDIKREIINTLYHDHKLTQKEIARIFGKSENAIWVMLQNKTKKKVFGRGLGESFFQKRFPHRITSPPSETTVSFPGLCEPAHL